MVFDFFKKKRQHQAPAPNESRPYELSSSSLEKIPALRPLQGQRPDITHDPHDPHFQSRHKHGEAPADFTMVGNELTISGVKYSLLDVDLEGRPTRNLVIGHGLDIIYSYKIERFVLPIGVVYFSETFHRDAPQDYHTQCMIHMALRDMKTEHAFSRDELYRFMWDQEKQQFFKRLMSNLDEPTSEVSGLELRMYQSIEHIPGHLFSKLCIEGKIHPID